MQECFFIYVLKSDRDKRFYIGSTENINRRLKYHNSGKVKSTRGRRPFKLIYQEEFETRTEARKRENFLKTGRGRKVLREILER